MKTMLVTIPGKVAVVLDPAQETTPGGIYIPETARDHCAIGTVYAIAQESWYEDGALRTPLCDIGDKIAIGRWAGTIVRHHEYEVVILKQTDILAVLKPIPSPSALPLPVTGGGCPA